MKKRWIALLSVLAMVAVLCCGCGTGGNDSSGLSFVGDDEESWAISDGDSSQDGDEAESSGGDVDHSSSGNGTTTNKNKTTTTTKGGASSTGNTSLKGQTVRMASALALTARVRKQINAFKKEYQLKDFKVDVIGYADYIQNLSTAMAGGTRYDIVQMENNRYPQMVISNLVAPLDDVLKDSDFGTGKLDKENTQKMMFKGKYYAAISRSGEYGGHPLILYYNKALIEEVGCDDPRELYEKGKWNFDTFYKLGEEVRDYYKGKGQNRWLIDFESLQRAPGWNNGSTLDESGDKPVVSFNSAMINGLNFMRKCCYGENKIAIYDTDGNGSYGTAERLAKGTIVMGYGADFDLYENCNLGEKVEASSVFKKSLKNLGMVPPPMGPDNTEKVYGTYTGLYGISAGFGSSNPRIAVEYALFCAGYNWENTSKYKWSTADQKVLDSMMSGKISAGYATYSDGTTDYSYLSGKLKNEIAKGAEVTQTINKYKSQLQKCIDVTYSQMK